MTLSRASHKKELREAGWRSRGYLPHFDGLQIPQFITLRLADSIPKKVVKRWQSELSSIEDKEATVVLQRRIEK